MKYCYIHFSTQKSISVKILHIYGIKLIKWYISGYDKMEIEKDNVISFKEAISKTNELNVCIEKSFNVYKRLFNLNDFHVVENFKFYFISDSFN